MKNKIALIFTLIIFSLSSHLFAGKLGDFEKDVTMSHPADDRKKNTDNVDEDSSILGEIVGMILEGLAETAIYILEESLKEGIPPDFFSWKRQWGEYKMPFALYDYNFHNVDSDITANEFRFEGGYGPLALQFRQTTYKEKNPDDKLELENFHALLRIPLGRRLQIHPGVGTIAIAREELSTGGSFTLPIQIRPTSYMRLEFRPTWSKISGTKIKDHNLNVLFGKRYVGLRTGYRWVKSGGTSLNGPFIGCSVYF